MLEAIKERLAKATPGPWRWVIDLRHRDIRLDAGSRVVMDFARYGMQGAQPRFRLPQYGDVLVEMSDLAKDPSLLAWPHPDAELIAHAPADIAALVAELERVCLPTAPEASAPFLEDTRICRACGAVSAMALEAGNEAGDLRLSLADAAQQLDELRDTLERQSRTVAVQRAALVEAEVILASYAGYRFVRDAQAAIGRGLQDG
jgi:hypothetical protein